MTELKYPRKDNPACILWPGNKHGLVRDVWLSLSNVSPSCIYHAGRGKCSLILSRDVRFEHSSIQKRQEFAIRHSLDTIFGAADPNKFSTWLYQGATLSYPIGQFIPYFVVPGSEFLSDSTADRLYPRSKTTYHLPGSPWIQSKELFLNVGMISILDKKCLVSSPNPAAHWSMVFC